MTHISRILATTVLISLCLPGSTFAQNAPSLRVPADYKVTVYADNELAHDIYSMTIDSLGRVVVSGSGYVRILIDSDDDGVADTYREYVAGPKSGAQGMFFHGRHLLCSGDEGLMIYRDDDRDDQADGDPEVFLKIRTGGEHTAHSIQRGPDGWWYVIAGNLSDVNDAYASLSTSPIKNPKAGTIMRIKPDLTGSEIIADGFRNAYDFAFTPLGDILTFDSDGEREVSLPWYRPTRVFHALPGSNAGWISRSWKKPRYFADMPPVVGAFGRGSPTGVACYDHMQFPKSLHGGVFVLDWTFGRVLALPLTPKDATYASKPFIFMRSSGQYGFAPTDIEVGPDGSLFVSVGGRGTRGTVFKVTYEGDDRGRVPVFDVGSIDSVLNAPQPLSSWSRGEWVPAAEKLGASVIQKAAVDTKRSVRERMRAIEILTELFGGLNASTLARIAKSKDAPVRARAAWSIGRIDPASAITSLKPMLADDDPLVQRFAWEALVTLESESPVLDDCIKLLADAAGSKNAHVRAATVRLMKKLSRAQYSALLKVLDRRNVMAVLTVLHGRLERDSRIDINGLDVTFSVLESKYKPEAKRTAVRLLQMALGEVGPAGLPPAYDGYASTQDLKPLERKLDPYRTRIAKLFPTGDKQLDLELARVVAMLAPYNADLVDALIEQITETSNPVNDLHHLITISLLEVERNGKQTQAIAQSLVQLDQKIKQRKMKQDSNWETRVGEIYARLLSLDAALGQAVIDHDEFGRPGHIIFRNGLNDEQQQQLLNAFAKAVADDTEFEIRNDIVFALGDSKGPAHRQIVRDLYEDFSVRNAVQVVLARDPQPKDREKFVAGLNAAPVNVIQDCAKALAELPRTKDPHELFTLLKTARRLNSDKREFEIRESLVRLLQHNTDESFEFQFGKEGHKPQLEALGRWGELLAKRFPEESRKQLGSDSKSLEELSELMQKTDWDSGNAERGHALFRKRACAQCHGSSRALGPDLAGVASRFSRDDLFTAIVAPNRDVSPRYQTETVETRDGRVFSGLIIYQSVDGLLMRDSTNRTFRIESFQIESRRRTPTSLMPAGLLKDLKSSDLADLYAYLLSLSPTEATDSAGE